MRINPPLFQSLVKLPQSGNNMRWDSQLQWSLETNSVGISEMSASREQEELTQPPWRTKPGDQLLSSSQPNWDFMVLPAAMEPQLCSWRAPAKREPPVRTTQCWRPWRGAERHSDGFWIQEFKFGFKYRHIALAVCVSVCKFCVCASYRGLYFLTFLNPQHHVIILGKRVREEGPSFMHISSKRADSSCKQVMT